MVTKNEHGLTPKREAFAAGLAAGMTQAAAYRAAYPRAEKWADRSVWVESSELAANPEVRRRVADLQAAAAAANGVTAERVVARLRDIGFADARELSELHRYCCRYCWGVGFRYQRTAGEMERDREAHAAARDAGKKVGAFDEKGGAGFYARKPPNEQCPECAGFGVERVVLNDTRRLSSATAALFAGVKATEKGIEVRAHDQPTALIQLARITGAFEKDNAQSRPETRVVIVPAKRLPDEAEESKH